MYTRLPCSHKAIHCGTRFIYCVPTLVPQICKMYAHIAIGQKASTDLSFYGGLHDGTSDVAEIVHQDGWLYPDFSAPKWDLIRAKTKSNNENDFSSPITSGIDQENVDNLCSAIDSFADDLKRRLRETNVEQLIFGADKFVNRYKMLKVSAPLLTLAFHCFGWTYSGSVTSRKRGKIRHGLRIAVQARGAGRRSELP